MGKIKTIHLAVKEISEIYEKDTIYPKWVVYPFWFVVLSIIMVVGGNNGKNK